jgi:peptide/nickel transport system substrate-binding protein
MSKTISRRQFLQIATVTMGGAVLAACGAPATTAAPAPATAAPATAAPATAAPAPATAAPATAAPATAAPAKIPDVPRNRTVNLAWSVSSPIGTTNALASPGYTHQEGNSLLNEGLGY